jgi:hypothetical protein
MTFRNLFCFRKLCRDCKKVLDYLAISEVIETMEDLVQFVKDLRDVPTYMSSSDYTVKKDRRFYRSQPGCH